MNTPSAAWPLPSLMTSLSRAGWGILSAHEHKGSRAVLRALTDLLPHGSAEGLSTAAQVADVAGLSERWARKCLQTLEDLGIIRWNRGGIAYGKPRPSHFRIVKARLASMIKAARPEQTEREATRKVRTEERMKKIKRMFVASPKRKRSSLHTEVTTGPFSLQGGTGTVSGPVECIHGTDISKPLPNGSSRCPLCRAKAKPKPKTVEPKPLFAGALKAV